MSETYCPDHPDERWVLYGRSRKKGERELCGTKGCGKVLVPKPDQTAGLLDQQKN